MIAQHLKDKNPASKFGATPLHDAAMAKGVCNQPDVQSYTSQVL